MANYTFIDTLHTGFSPLKPDSILSQTVFQDERSKVTVFHFSEGQALTEHSSAKPVMIQILKGDALLTLGKDEVQASEGAWMHLPATLVHSVKALTPMSMLLTVLNY